MTETDRAPRAVSLRTKLVALLLVVEAAALAFLVWQGHEMDLARSENDFQGQLAQVRPLLNASLARAVADTDLETVGDVLRQGRTGRGIQYFVVEDAAGRVLAAEGRDPTLALPRLNGSLESAVDDGHYDTLLPLAIGKQSVGTLHFGIATRPWQDAIDAQLRDSVFKAAGAFLMSVLLFLLVVHPLTRRLTQLRRASERIAEGDYSIHIPDNDTDDVGLLAGAFNRMAALVRARVEELEASRQRFHTIADYTYDVECWFSPEGKLVWINSSVERLTGYTAAECLENGAFPWFLICPDDLARVTEASHRALREHTTGSDFEFRIVKKDGAKEWLTNSWQPIYDPAGTFLGLRSSLNSIQGRKDVELDLRKTLARLEEAGSLQARTAETLRAERSRLISLLSAMNFGVVFVDGGQRIIYSNPAFADVWSIPRDEAVLGLSLFDALEKAEDVVSDLDTFSTRLGQIVSDRHATSNTELHLMSGRILRLQVYPVLDDNNSCLGSVLIHEDITLQRKSETQLAFLAERDALTGLYNRRRFERELSEQMDRCEQHGERIALLFFDLDEFKSVNDLFGHRMGDTVLTQVAAAIRSHLRKNEFFARIGGDEFALLVTDVSDENIRALADRLMQVVGGMSFNLGEVRLSLTSSLGVAIYPEHASSPQELIAHADAAMYQAKDGGKNTWRVYRPDHTATLRQRSLVTWNDRIRHALKHDAFEVHLQGVYGTADRKRRYHEALLRMPDPASGKILAPGTFIGFAEKSNLIIDLDRWMVARVISLLAARPELGPVAVNISGRSFDEPEMASYIEQCLARHAVDPSRLFVEITETAAIRDMRDAQRFIHRLHEVGCKVCLDDFGAGFSTFAYIKQLPVDVLKIDGLFVKNLAAERDNQVFMKAMLDMARGFGKQVVAEAVEDLRTLEMLTSYGVDMAQGYVFEAPRRVDMPDFALLPSQAPQAAHSRRSHHRIAR